MRPLKTLTTPPAERRQPSSGRHRASSCRLSRRSQPGTRVFIAFLARTASEGSPEEKCCWRGYWCRRVSTEISCFLAWPFLRRERYGELDGKRNCSDVERKASMSELCLLELIPDQSRHWVCALYCDGMCRYSNNNNNNRGGGSGKLGLAEASRR